MIGGIGLMNWLLAWQVSRIVAITSSTCPPSATRASRRLGREARKLIDLAADVRGHRFLEAVAVDHDKAAGLGRGEAQIALPDALVERAVVPVEAVPACRSRSSAEPRQRDGDRNVDEEGALRDERPYGEARHRAESVEVGPEAITLVRQRRVEVPVRDDDLPFGERRADHVSRVLRPRGRKEQGLRLGSQVDLARM